MRILWPFPIADFFKREVVGKGRAYPIKLKKRLEDDDGTFSINRLE